MQGWLELRAEDRDYIIGGDYAGQCAVLIHYREREQVVLIKNFSDFALIGLRRTGDEWIDGQLGEPRVRVGDHEFGERDGSDELFVLADEEDGLMLSRPPSKFLSISTASWTRAVGASAM